MALKVLLELALVFLPVLSLSTGPGALARGMGGLGDWRGLLWVIILKAGTVWFVGV